MTDNVKREVNFLKDDITRTTEILETGKKKFSDDLKSSLGVEIESYLKNPPKEDKNLKRKVIRKRKWNEFKQKFSRMFIDKKETEGI